jgi:hypothetical protein
MQLPISPQQAAEKVEFGRAAVAQALLPVLIWLHLLVAHSQEWLCHRSLINSLKKGPSGNKFATGR